MPRKKIVPAAEPTAETPASEVAETPKAKRPWVRRAPVALPEVPNPAIAALQNDILELVKQRSTAIQGISDATQRAAAAQAQLSSAQQFLATLEQEVQYRMSLIGQMKGGSGYAYPGLTGFASQADAAKMQQQAAYDIQNGMGVSIPPGVSSIPTQTPQMGVVQGGRRVRMESAELERATEISARAAI